MVKPPQPIGRQKEILVLLAHEHHLVLAWCGRLFEVIAKSMWNSLNKLTRLLESMLLHCAPEHTEANGSIAFSVDPDNTDLQERMEEVRKLRSKNILTFPTSLDMKKQTNSFLRTGNEESLCGDSSPEGLLSKLSNYTFTPNMKRISNEVLLSSLASS